MMNSYRSYIMSTAATFSLITMFAVSSAIAQTQVPNQVIDSRKGVELDQFFTQLNKFGFHGSVLVAQKGEIVLNKAYGLSQPINNTAWTTETPASIGSVVKQFTAAAIMRLEMQHKLSTDDLISKYLENVPTDKQDITLHHLLTHSAGLPEALGDDFEKISKKRYFEQAMAVELATVPGELYEYSNVGFSLLAMIIEEVSGLKYEEFLHKELFDPLSMNQTGWRLPKWDPSQVSQSHENKSGENSLLDLPSERWHIEGNGGLYSTTADMYRWYMALQGDEILSAEAKKKMFTRHIAEGPDARSFYGYGWVVMDTRRGGDVIWHNGGGAAGAFAMYHYVNDSSTFIVFTNKRMDGDYPMDDVAIYSSMILFGDEYPSPPEVITLDNKNLEAKSGIYTLDDGSTLEVTSSEGALEITPHGQSAMNALYPSEMAPMLNKYNQKSVELFGLLSSGDFAGAADLFEPQMPKDEIADMLRDGWLEEDSLGALTKIIPHGVRLGEAAEAFLTLVYENGTKDFKCVWMMGHCMGFRSENPVPSTRMLPISETSFASFSLKSGKTIVSFNMDESLIIAGQEGEIRAIRGS